jgi:osmoprotectant transport system substrate-binding protein
MIDSAGYRYRYRSVDTLRRSDDISAFPVAGSLITRLADRIGRYVREWLRTSCTQCRPSDTRPTRRWSRRDTEGGLLQIMRTLSRPLAIAAGLVMAAGFTAACGSAGSSGTAKPSTVSGAGCAGVAGTDLVVLTDDKHLQQSDVVVPAINKAASNPQLIAALDAVSTGLDTNKLIALNKLVDSGGQTPAAAAAAYVQQNNLTSNLQKGPGGPIKIGAADFSENEEIANVYKLVLASIGYSPTVQTIGNRELYLPQLEQNKIQIVPEYAASLLTALNTTNNPSQAPTSDINETMPRLTALGAQKNLVFGKPSTALDTNAFAVTKGTADKYGLKTLSDFAAKCSGKATTLAGPAECPQRPFCQQGLQKTYGIQFGQFLSQGSDAGGPITKKTIQSGRATIGLVFSSDSSLTTS